MLFPYSEKHDPYCATTGTRLFPRKQSLEVDDKGTRDSIAVVISPEPIDYDDLNTAITGAEGEDYAAKLTEALGNRLDPKGRTRTVDNLIELTTSSQEAEKVQLLVLEFDKG